MRTERMNINLSKYHEYPSPLSPHLPTYMPQFTSTFSISHRISGASLATLLFFFYLLYLNIGVICFTYENFYQFFFYSSRLILISIKITALSKSYHLYMGFFFLRIGRKILKRLFQISTIPFFKI